MASIRKVPHRIGPIPLRLLSRQLERIWQDGRSAWFLISLFAILSVWTFFARPSPGTSIGLLATAAGLMSLRLQPHILEKLGWVAVLILLMISEVLSIAHADRKSLSDKAALNARFESLQKIQQDHFEATIRDLQLSIITGRTAIGDSQEQFLATADKLDRSLKAVYQTLDQTRPFALVQTDSDSKFSGFDMKQESGIERVAYKNFGNGNAREIWKLVETFLEPADPFKAELVIMPVFDKDWKSHLLLDPGGILKPGDTRTTDSPPTPFGPWDVESKRSQGWKLYRIFRVKYSDDTGTYVSTECIMSALPLPNPGASNPMTINCPFSNTPRQSTKLTGKALLSRQR